MKLTRLLCIIKIVLVGFILYSLLLRPWESAVQDDSNTREPRLLMSYRMQLGNTSDCNTLCLDRLSEEERRQHDTCYNKTVSVKIAKKFGPIRSGSCHFQHGYTRYPVGLGSFQGSGNTWLRGLLEKLTGICTGIFSIKLAV